jgi:uncharacterized protein (DUF934 family)
MPILRNGAVIEDKWVLLDEADEPQAGTPLVVPSEIWRASRDRYLKWYGPLGIRLSPADEPSAIAHDFGRFELIEIDFPVFGDGRGFSIARLLRERYDYQGELRAVGDILRDQFLFLDRCGFDTLAVRQDQVGAWKEALSELSTPYQAATDKRTTVLSHRHPAKAAE